EYAPTHEPSAARTSASHDLTGPRQTECVTAASCATDSCAGMSGRWVSLNVSPATAHHGAVWVESCATALAGGSMEMVAQDSPQACASSAIHFNARSERPDSQLAYPPPTSLCAPRNHNCVSDCACPGSPKFASEYRRGRNGRRCSSSASACRTCRMRLPWIVGSLVILTRKSGMPTDWTVSHTPMKCTQASRPCGDANPVLTCSAMRSRVRVLLAASLSRPRKARAVH